MGRLRPGATETYNLPRSIPEDDYSVRFQLESMDRTLDRLTDAIVAVPGEEIILVIPNERCHAPLSGVMVESNAKRRHA